MTRPYDSFKHRRRSIRLRGYDYAQAGAYFVTICEKNRACIFGDVVDDEMRPNPLGEIVLKWWEQLPVYYPSVELDEFVVMPNHLHGIIVIAEHVEAESSRSSTPVKKRTLGQLVGYFKFEITKEINQIRDTGYAKVFQRDYYERIIRNEHEWAAIAEYIRNNPMMWSVELDNPANFDKRSPPKTADEYWNDVGL